MSSFLAAILTLPLIGAACSGTASPGSNTANANSDTDKGDKKKKKDKETDEPPNANASADAGKCDQKLWDRVYKSDRLEIKDQCKVVTGTIAERNADEDGDEHMLLKLDAGQDALLTKKNEKKKDGNLVIEAVCVNPTKLKKVGSTCDGFTNPVTLPQVGDHVRVTGTYVLDTHNGWSEIHPITSVEKLQ